MQKRQDLLKVLAFLHFRDFSYSLHIIVVFYQAAAMKAPLKFVII